MAIPSGTIIGYLGTSAPPGWTLLSSDYHGYLIKGYNHLTISASSPAYATGIAHTHTPPSASNSSNFAHNHGVSTFSIGGVSPRASGGTGANTCPKNHTHDVTMTFGDDTSVHSHTATFTVSDAPADAAMPQYKRLLLIIKD